MADRDTFTLLILGDFSYGESYGDGQRILEHEGYGHSTAYLQPFIDASDAFVLNLETPLAREDEFPSPFRDEKPWVHWADPEGTGQALTSLGVDAVSLANNHTVDLGHAGLAETFKNLDKLGISYFGAGKTRKDAEAPYRIQLPPHVGGGEIYLHASFQFSRSRQDRFQEFAESDAPGAARITTQRAPDPLAGGEGTKEGFHIAFPHWGANYKWKSERQEALANVLTTSRYDLVIGHGPHTLQEISRKNGKWVVYSIGNGNFCSGGRWEKFESSNGILPYSFWTVLEVKRARKGLRKISLKLYPVYSDNKVSGFQPRPVDEPDFDRIADVLESRTHTAGALSRSEITQGKDELGHFFRLDVSDWPDPGAHHSSGSAHVVQDQSGQKTSTSGFMRLVKTRVRRSGAFNWLRGHTPEKVKSAVRRNRTAEAPGKAISSPDLQNTYDTKQFDSVWNQLARSRHIGVVETARAAERDSSAELTWFEGNYVKATLPDRHIPIFKFLASESVVASGIMKDKQLTKDLLAAHGVPVPAGRIVTSAEDAIRAQHEIGRPIVLKPLNGNMGRGVTVNIDSPESIRAAFDRAADAGREVLVEQFIDGDEYRAHATGSECVGMFRRILPEVIGDGESTVAELIRRKNQLRERNPSTKKSPVPIDDVGREFLARHGLSLETVIPEGESVVVRDVNGVTSGGDSEECLDSVSDTLKTAAMGAVAAIPGTGWCGVDLLVDRESGVPYVIELNSDAAFYGSSFPVYGQRRDVGAALWRNLTEFSAPESTGPIGHLAVNATPEPIVPAAEEWASEVVSLQQLLQSHLEVEGQTVTRHGGRIWSSLEGGGGRAWYSGARNVDDRVAATHPLRRPYLLQKLLEAADVPVPSATIVKTAAEFDEFRSQHDCAISLRPLNPAKSRGQRPIHVEQTLSTMDEAVRQRFESGIRWYAQTHQRGFRLQILATSERPLMVTSSARENLPTQDMLNLASEMSVQAVRSIPQLRWAGVQLAYLPEDETNPLRVEGLTLNPRFGTADAVVAGSLASAIEAAAYGQTPEDAKPLLMREVVSALEDSSADEFEYRGDPDAPFHGFSAGAGRRARGKLAVMVDGNWSKGHQRRFGSVSEDPKGLLRKAAQSGATGIVFPRDSFNAEIEGLLSRQNYFVVENSLQFCLELSSVARRLLPPATVTAITGSVGKSSTAAMVAHALSSLGYGRVSMPEGNQNLFYQLASRLAATEVTAHRVTEVAASACKVFRREGFPLHADVSLVTSISEAHMQGIESLMEIADIKSEVFAFPPAAGGTGIVCTDTPHADLLVERVRESGRTLVTYGRSREDDISLVNYDYSSGEVEAQVDGNRVRYCVGARGEHMAMNSLAVIAVLRGHGIASWLRGVKSLETFEPIFGRGETVTLHLDETRSVTVIDESYNANPASIRSTLGAMHARQVPDGSRKVAILGDILELGTHADSVHRDLVEPVIAAELDEILLFGGEMAVLHEELRARSVKSHHFATLNEMTEALPGILDAHDVVLAKASGSTGLKDWLKENSK